MPASSLYCRHKSASMSSAAARNRRMSKSPCVAASCCALAVGALANSPAPMVPAPAASDLPKKERRLRKLCKGLTLSSKLSLRASTLFMDGSLTLGLDVEVVNNDAVAFLIGFMMDTSDAGYVCRNSALVGSCGETYEVTLAPSFGIADYATFY